MASSKKKAARAKPGPAVKPGGGKSRADALLATQGLVESRTRAQTQIMAGNVYLGERRINKPGEMLPANAVLNLRGPDHPWVSRGGLKLEHALAHFDISVSEFVCLDVGASTGGFTDVLLTNDAAKVYAVDVGKGQLAWKLRNDPRVSALEGANARNLTEDDVPEQVDIIVCDASFIGLEKVLAAPLQFAKPAALLIALIKPQFQAGRDQIGKGGVVRDPEIHQAVCDSVRHWLESEMSWRVIGVTESPITGPKGNKEFLIAAQGPT
jgi:23S rRNA (cytidine1920-2'-O)/16S rRNA (cytidine1409-2'-O)-methyltransferase